MSARVETIGAATLILGDCRQIVPTLPRPAALIGDPPYGIGYERGGGGRGVQAGRRKIWGTIVGDEADFDPTPWLDAADAVVLWGANHFARHLPRGRWLAWNKLGNHEPWDSFSDVEFAWCNRRGNDKIFSLLWKGIAQGEKIDNGERHHPTMKPRALMEWCITQARVLPGGAILDPWMGSGTTLIAAIRRGHPCTGVEIDPVHYETALRRVEAAARQADLFVPPPRRAPDLDAAYQRAGPDLFTRAAPDAGAVP